MANIQLDFVNNYWLFTTLREKCLVTSHYLKVKYHSYLCYFLWLLPDCLRRRTLSLWMAKHQSLEMRKISDISLLCTGIHTESGRLKEVQSRINWDKILGDALYRRIPDVACTLDTVFINSGNSLCRTLEVARQRTNTCSVGSEQTEMSSSASLQSEQAWLEYLIQN